MYIRERSKINSREYWENEWIIGRITWLDRIALGYIQAGIGGQVWYDVLIWLATEAAFVGIVIILSLLGVTVIGGLIGLIIFLLFGLNLIGSLNGWVYTWLRKSLKRGRSDVRVVSVAKQEKLFSHIARAATHASFARMCEAGDDVVLKPEIDQALRNPNIQDALEQISILSSSSQRQDQALVNDLWDFIDRELQPVHHARSDIERGVTGSQSYQLERSREIARSLLQIGEIKRTPIE